MVVEDLILSMSGIKPSLLRSVMEQVSSAADLWHIDTQQLRMWGLSDSNISKIFSSSLRERAQNECEFLFKNHVRALSIKDKDYPFLLKQCIDAPVVLYVMGDLDINEHYKSVISIVGTRNSSIYGENSCRKLIEELSVHYPNTTIVSGLALGIDSVAHRASLQSKLKTVAVLAHGLDMIHPTSNFSLAQDILASGGALVSEYPSATSVFRHHFLARNRIVAGISTATILIESPAKGGSMMTASLANDYDRSVFALPGRINDINSEGCNNLIKSSRAQLISSLADMEYELGWEKELSLTQLFEPDLAGVEKRIYDCFEGATELSSEEIIQRLGIDASQFYQSITMLELQGCIKSVRGNLYIKS